MWGNKVLPDACQPALGVLPPSSNEDGCTATAPERAPYYNERWGRYYETHACMRALQQENFLLPVRLIINVEKQADARGLGVIFCGRQGDRYGYGVLQ